MKVPNSVHTARSWRIKEIVPDFALLDVWALPAYGAVDDFNTLLELMVAFDPANLESAPARFLWRVRDLLGQWFDLGRISVPVGSEADHDPEDRTGPGSTAHTLTDRLPSDLQNTAGHLEFARLPFVPLYRTDVEFAAEVSNRTVHGVMHLAWADQGHGHHQAQMAVYVKPRGLLGHSYMKLIEPFRQLIVYPALMRQIRRTWGDSEVEKGVAPTRLV